MAQTLKEAREAKGIKQLSVADHIGVARQTYAHYEEHPERMRIEQAEQVCDYIGVPFDSIFFGKTLSKT